MLIKTKDDLIVATSLLSDVAKHEVNVFIQACYAAPSLNALAETLDNVTVEGDCATFLVKPNEQHVAACVRLTVKPSGSADLVIQCYD